MNKLHKTAYFYTKTHKQNEDSIKHTDKQLGAEVLRARPVRFLTTGVSSPQSWCKYNFGKMQMQKCLNDYK